ncbi:putative 200 kDa antigen p200, partial [Toxoplasma gondii CAST]
MAHPSEPPPHVRGEWTSVQQRRRHLLFSSLSPPSPGTHASPPFPLPSAHAAPFASNGVSPLHDSTEPLLSGERRSSQTQRGGPERTDGGERGERGRRGSPETLNAALKAAGEMVKYAASQWERAASQSESLVAALKVSLEKETVSRRRVEELEAQLTAQEQRMQLEEQRRELEREEEKEKNLLSAEVTSLREQLRSASNLAAEQQL